MREISNPVKCFTCHETSFERWACLDSSIV